MIEQLLHDLLYLSCEVRVVLQRYSVQGTYGEGEREGGGEGGREGGRERGREGERGGREGGREGGRGGGGDSSISIKLICSAKLYEGGPQRGTVLT